MFSNSTNNNQFHQKSGTGLGSLCLSLGVAIYLCLFCLASPVHADVTATGDVDPADPTTWTSDTHAYIGKTGSGTLDVTNGDGVSAKSGTIGYESDSVGEVMINGQNSTWNIVGNYLSGSLSIGFFGNGTLEIVSGGAVSNHGSTIGSRADSTGEATVDGIGSTWIHSGGIFIGNSGSGKLNITGGGEVKSPRSSSIGNFTDSSGVVTVDGTGSLWDMRGSVSSSKDFFIGNYGNGTLNITSGGKVIHRDRSYIGHYAGSMGVVTVDGVNSMWDHNYDTLYVGYEGNGSLNILNGGKVENYGGIISRKSGSTGVVTVDGTGSTWTNNYLQIGGILNIAKGGVVNSEESDISGVTSSAGEVTVDGIGSTWNSNTLLIGSTKGGVLNITNGGMVNAQYNTWVSRHSNYSGKIYFHNGTLTTRGIRVASDELVGTGMINTHGVFSDVDLVFDATHGLNQTFSINKNAEQNITVHLNINGLGVMGAGYGGVGTMRISDGVHINSRGGGIGYKPNATGEVTVDGPGSKWDVKTGSFSQDFHIGNYGNGTLNITNGGEVSVSDQWSYIGYHSNSTGVVTVDGNGSKWFNMWNILVGNSGHGTLNITNGGEVNSMDGSIGLESDSTGVVVVDGIGSTWTNRESLSVGHGTLNITHGGKVVSMMGGYINNSSVVTVDGIGSTWTNGHRFQVGSGSEGTLNILNGGTVNSNKYNDIGYRTNSTGQITVDGTSSAWNSVDLYVGYYGKGTLDITNGGLVNIEKEIWIAQGSGSLGTIHFDNGTLKTSSFFGAVNDLAGTGTISTRGFVSDVDLIFDSTHGLNQTFKINKNTGQDITVNLNVDGSGSMGAGYHGYATLHIRDGLVIESKTGYIGYHSGSKGAVTVDGVGSKWNVNGVGSAIDENRCLSVGYYGNGTLNIINGGEVNGNGWVNRIGSESGSSGIVTVNGTGSKWINRSGLVIGSYGKGTLNIINGGEVSGKYGSIGTHGMGVVTVEGVGSKWINSESLTLNHGTMVIMNGGAVSNIYGYVGRVNNTVSEVTVDGIGSTWTNTFGLYVGVSGSGTLNITHGGFVSVSRTLRIDENGDGDSFVNMASGGMLALSGDADDSLSQFLDLVEGTDAIRYWDESAFGWADIMGATDGVDYTLGLGAGDLAGYTVLTVLAEVPVLGDVNGDGVVDGFDVDPFVDVLLGNGYQVEADANQDGVVNGFDVDPFVALVLGGGNGDGPGGVEVPEPTTLVLLGLGGLVCRWRKCC